MLSLEQILQCCCALMGAKGVHEHTLHRPTGAIVTGTARRACHRTHLTLLTAAALQRSGASRKLSRRTSATDMAAGKRMGDASSTGAVQPW